MLTALTAAPRSRAQLETKLAAKGAPADVAARVLDRFEEVGLIDDAEFARSLVRTRQASRGLAGRALRQELRRNGVDDEVATAALAELDPDAGAGDGPGAGGQAAAVDPRPAAAQAGGPAQRPAGPQGLPELAWPTRWSVRPCWPTARTISTDSVVNRDRSASPG